jgi:hypothetical protein
MKKYIILWSVILIILGQAANAQMIPPPTISPNPLQVPFTTDIQSWMDANYTISLNLPSTYTSDRQIRLMLKLSIDNDELLRYTSEPIQLATTPSRIEIEDNITEMILQNTSYGTIKVMNHDILNNVALSRKLPAGAVSICTIVLDSNLAPISNQSCSPQYRSFNPQPPVALSPRQNAYVNANAPIWFRWMNFPIPGFGMKNEIHIFQVYEGQTPVQALMSNQPLQVHDVGFATQWAWHSIYSPVLEGDSMHFVWEVETIFQANFGLNDKRLVSQPTDFWAYRPTAIQPSIPSLAVTANVGNSIAQLLQFGSAISVANLLESGPALWVIQQISSMQASNSVVQSEASLSSSVLPQSYDHSTLNDLLESILGEENFTTIPPNGLDGLMIAQAIRDDIATNIGEDTIPHPIMADTTNSNTPSKSADDPESTDAGSKATTNTTPAATAAQPAPENPSPCSAAPTDLGEDLQIAKQRSIPIHLGVPADPRFDYEWVSDPPSEPIYGSAIDVLPTQTTRYILTKTDANGECTSSDEIWVVVVESFTAKVDTDACGNLIVYAEAAPPAKASQGQNLPNDPTTASMKAPKDTTIVLGNFIADLKGMYIGTVQFPAKIPVAKTPPPSPNCKFSYDWGKDGQGNKLNTRAAGTYTVTVTDGLRTDTIEVEYRPTQRFHGGFPALSVPRVVVAGDPELGFVIRDIAGPSAAIPAYNARSFTLAIWRENGPRTIIARETDKGFENGEIKWDGVLDGHQRLATPGIYYWMLTLTNCDNPEPDPSRLYQIRDAARHGAAIEYSPLYEACYGQFEIVAPTR